MMSSEAIWFETCVDCRAEFMATSTTQCCSVVGEAQTLGSIDIGLPGVAGIRESRRKGPSGNARRGYVRSRGRCLPRGVCHPCVFETTPEHQENKVHPGEHQDSPGPKMSNPRRSHATLQPADSQHAKDQPDAAASAVMRSRSAVSVATLQPQTQFDWDAEWENGGAFGYWIPQDSQECHNSFVPPWRIAARMVVLLILWVSQAHIGTQTAEESRRAFQNTENWYNETDPNDWQVLMKAFGATIYLQRHAPNATPCFFLDVSVAGAQRFTNGARALVIPYTCSTWRQSMAVKLDAKIMPTKLRDALVNGPWLCEGVVADNKLSPHQLQGVTLRFAGCRLLGGMMPQQPDFDKMQLTDLEELTPYFKCYGITKTAPNAFGKHKKKDIETIRAEFKALRQSDVEEAWQRYQEATTKAQPVKPASVEDEDASPGAHVYPKKANGLYDFERMNKHQLRSLVTAFKDHGARHGDKKNAMIAQFTSLSDEIVQKVMQQQAQKSSIIKEFGTKKTSELRALTKSPHSTLRGPKSKRELLEDIREIERNKAENSISKAFSKAAGGGVPEGSSSQGAQMPPELHAVDSAQPMGTPRKSWHYKNFLHAERRKQPKSKEKHRQLMATPEHKEKHRQLMATPQHKEKHSQFLRTPEQVEKQRARSAHCYASPEGLQQKREQYQQSRDHRHARVTAVQVNRAEFQEGSSNAWTATAAAACAQEGLPPGTIDMLPPPYAELNDVSSLHMAQSAMTMLGPCLSWRTCVVCWKAWYSIQEVHEENSREWISLLHNSEIRKKWEFDASAHNAYEFLETHHSDNAHDLLNHLVECSCGAVGKTCACNAGSGAAERIAMLRDVNICEECAAHVRQGQLKPCAKGQLRRRDMVVDPVCIELHGTEKVVREAWHAHRPSGDKSTCPMIPILGRTLQDFARPLAELTDLEEMVISLVHPLVQVYTIPSTGELAYVGHVCNFRQHVSEFLETLPVRPKDMPFVLVRPRRKVADTNPKPRQPFRIDVHKLRCAFDWLKEHNPLYKACTWNQKAEQEWQSDEPQLPTRDDVLSATTSVTQAEFMLWMQHATRGELLTACDAHESVDGHAQQILPSTSDDSFTCGRQLHDALMQKHSDTTPWNALRRVVAEQLDKTAFRAASSLSQNEIALVAASLDVLDLGENVGPHASLDEINALDVENWSDTFVQMASEIYTIKCIVAGDEEPSCFSCIRPLVFSFLCCLSVCVRLMSRVPESRSLS